jgi:hypothetical protein
MARILRARIEFSQNSTPKLRIMILGSIIRNIKIADTQGFFPWTGSRPFWGRGKNRGHTSAPNRVPTKLRRYIWVRAPPAEAGKKSNKTKLR